MTDEEIIRELKSVEERYRNKPVSTFEVNTSSMARSCRQHIEQLAKENEELRKNQIVWHNSDELPPVYENSSFSINVLTEDGVYVEYNFDAHHWIIAGTNRKIIVKKWTDSFPSSCK